MGALLCMRAAALKGEKMDRLVREQLEEKRK